MDFLATVRSNMAEETSVWTSERLAARKFISKRSIRKLQDKQNASLGGVRGHADPGDLEIFYLNPQTPKWNTADRLAEMSPEEDKTSRGGVQKRHYSSDLLACADDIPAKIPAPSPARTQEQDTAPTKVQPCSDPLPNQKVSTPNQSDASADGGGGQGGGGGGRGSGDSVPEGTAVDLQKGHAAAASTDSVFFESLPTDGKVPHIFAAMKKRGMDIDNELRRYKCTRCHWAFKKFCNLQSHLETHSGRKPHVCDVCGKAYSHQGTLQQHKRLHTGERPYRCPFCVKTYIWSSDYRKHIRTHTGEKPYACDACGKDFVRSSDLRKHERNMHTNDKPYPCGECGKTFNKPLSLKRHERKHLGDKPYSCSDCGKRFALASRLAEHEKVHRGGVRPFVCAVCAKSFTKSSNLLEHRAIHSGARPHKCEECGSSFAMASRLARHRLAHAGADFGQTTSSAPTAARHQEQSCGGRIFVCTDCDKAFACAAKLTEHALQVHKDGSA